MDYSSYSSHSLRRRIHVEGTARFTDQLHLERAVQTATEPFEGPRATQTPTITLCSILAGIKSWLFSTKRWPFTFARTH
ncbi:hypothetical protein PC128_g18967 [Phytophthora cactorum]|nr:hypothetical protein PC120_g16643 [Phytophthora cactorum]KAG3052596.1 hypothetical protein PC121_g17217 [Phytophthora cactorum]KAG3170175.1 hypothetical protein PC128_g18967 [Phytophthora cactorum]KAG4047802.1 hypothetical protein PC123_g16845 [Phytophthora cactorum]